jgi:hypothetical protein
MAGSLDWLGGHILYFIINIFHAPLLTLPPGYPIAAATGATILAWWLSLKSLFIYTELTRNDHVHRAASPAFRQSRFVAADPLSEVHAQPPSGLAGGLLPRPVLRSHLLAVPSGAGHSHGQECGRYGHGRGSSSSSLS